MLIGDIVMFKIAKSNDVENEKLEYEITKVVISKFDEVKNKRITEKVNELEITLIGEIGGDIFSIHFIVSKPINELLNIEKYTKINMSEKTLCDYYLMVNGIAHMCLKIDLEILRYNNTLVFTLDFCSDDNEYFGYSTFEIEMSKLGELKN